VKAPTEEWVTPWQAQQWRWRQP